MAPSSSAEGVAISLAVLFPALLQSFSVIAVGYLCVKLNVITFCHSQGLSMFVTKLALPSLLFLGMASLDFSVINWYFVLAVFLGKTAVFLAAIVVTVLLDFGKPSVLGTGTIHGIFATQSNDFALGLPIFKVMFDATHPEYVGYLYLVAPISLLILNPIGFYLLEASRPASVKPDYDPDPEKAASVPLLGDTHEASRVDAPECNECDIPGAAPTTVAGRQWTVLTNVLGTPMVFMVPVGLLANLIFGPKTPTLLACPFQVFGAAFPATALLILGMSIAEQADEAAGHSRLGPLTAALSIVGAKSLLLPLVIVQCLFVFKVEVPLALCGLLYGCLPAAPAVFFFAAEYGLAQAYAATAVVLCTFLFAPLVYIAAQLTYLVLYHYDRLLQQVGDVGCSLSWLGIICAVWTLLAMRRPRTLDYLPPSSPRRIFVCLIAVNWIATCIGTLLCNLDCATAAFPTLVLVRYALHHGGNMSTRVSVAALLVEEALSVKWGQEAMRRLLPLMVGASVALAALSTALPPLLGHLPDGPPVDVLHCWVPFGKLQYVVGGLTMLLSVLVSSGAIAAITLFRPADPPRSRLALSASWRRLSLTCTRAPLVPPSPAAPSPTDSAAAATSGLRTAPAGPLSPLQPSDLSPVTADMESQAGRPVQAFQGPTPYQSAPLLMAPPAPRFNSARARPMSMPAVPGVPSATVPGRRPNPGPQSTLATSELPATVFTPLPTSPLRPCNTSSTGQYQTHSLPLLQSPGSAEPRQLAPPLPSPLSMSALLSPRRHAEPPLSSPHSHTLVPPTLSPRGIQRSPCWGVAPSPRVRYMRTGSLPAMEDRGVATEAGDLIGWGCGPTEPQLTRAVTFQWLHATDRDHQNRLVIYGLYCVVSLACSTTISLWSAIQPATWTTPIRALMILLDTILLYGQGPLLFLVFGLEPGLLHPLVATRDWWMSYYESWLDSAQPVATMVRWADAVLGEEDPMRYYYTWERHNVLQSSA